MNPLLKIGLLILIGAVVGTVTAAYASTNDDPMKHTGEGGNEISGWVVSNVHYRSASEPTMIAGVEFDLNAPAQSVSVRLDSGSGIFFACQNLYADHWFCDTAGTLIVNADELRVIALGK